MHGHTILKIRFHENLSYGNGAILCGLTADLIEANSRFSKFCERALKMFLPHKKLCIVYYTDLLVKADKKYNTSTLPFTQIQYRQTELYG